MKEYHRLEADGYITTNYDNIKPRGPDETFIINNDDSLLVFHRLTINGDNSLESNSTRGMQPMHYNNCTIMCNGEIYNHKDLEKKYDISVSTMSDCEVLLHLYRIVGIEKMLDEIDGEFAFILLDNNQNVVHFARDPIGVKPLYMKTITINNKIEMLELSSTISGMYSDDQPSKVEHVIPRTLYTFDRANKTISQSPYCTWQYKPDIQVTEDVIYNCLVDAVIKRITNCNREVGFFLSGGIDSCTVLSIALANGKFNYVPQAYTFAFSEDAVDAVAAGKMVKWLKGKYGENCIKWHLVIDTIENGIGNIEETISVLETYDTTTIRAGCPMYMLSKYIAKYTPNTKVLLSGEGSDELFGGYLYNLYAPNKWAFRAEIIKALNEMYMYDVLRADRVTAACGLEVRPPFLDKVLILAVLSYTKLVPDTPTKLILRNVLGKNLVLPDEILHSRKEAFSDAVGLDWQDSIASYTYGLYENVDCITINDGIRIKLDGIGGDIRDITMVVNDSLIKVYSNTNLYFIETFAKIFGDMFHLLPKYWLPNQDWVDTGCESSARALPMY